MPAEGFATLELSTDAVLARIDFLITYARTVHAELTQLEPPPIDDFYEQRYEPHRPRGYGDDTEDPLRFLQDDGQRLLDADVTEPDEIGWLQSSDEATALREAAQWALLIEDGRARPLLEQASLRYSRLGQPFGLFLDTAAGFALDDGEREQLDYGILALQPGETEPPAGLGTATRLTVPPSQAAYLLLAAIGHGSIRERRHRELLRLVDDPAHRRAIVPVGALGIAAHRFWAIAEQLLEPADPVEVIGAHLSAMGRQYTEVMEQARANDYLWYNCAAAVDVVDLDIVATAALAERVLGRELLRELRYSGRWSMPDTLLDIAQTVSSWDERPLLR